MLARRNGALAYAATTFVELARMVQFNMAPLFDIQDQPSCLMPAIGTISEASA